MTVDNNDGIWFSGKLILNFNDTLYLNGFEKGSNHPTNVEIKDQGAGSATNLGMIFIWMQDIHADTIEIDNKLDTIANLPETLVLFKIKK